MATHPCTLNRPLAADTQSASVRRDCGPSGTGETIRNEFWQQLTPVLAAGFISSVNGITLSLAFAVLIFQGPLEQWLVTGIAMALMGSIIVAMVVGARSSLRGMVANVQDVPGVILALVVSAITVELSGTTNEPVLLATAIAAIAVTSLMVGVTFWLLGKFELGNIVRFVPYPVMGGFLAATGWILFSAGLQITVQVPEQTTLLVHLLQQDQLVYWVPAVVTGIAIYVAMNRVQHFMVLPGILLIGGLLIYLVMHLAGMSVAQATEQGFLLQVPENAVFKPVGPSDWLGADWLAIIRQLPLMIVLVFFCVVAMLLNVTGVEMSTGKPVSLDQDLRGAGLANCLSGLAGGAPGYHLVGMTTLTAKMGASNRWVGAVAAGFMVVPFLIGADIVNLLPKALLGGMLAYLGLDFLITWLYKSRSRLSITDYAIVWIILISSELFGFLQAVGVGILAASILFMVRYLRISVIRNQFSGAEYSSRRERTPSERVCLREQGDSIAIYQLHGYVFFGTAQQILKRWEERVFSQHADRLQYAIFDCRSVTGWDSSALFSVSRLSQLAEKHNVTLVVCDLSAAMQQMLQTETFVSPLHQFADLDSALEWCESNLLAGSEADATEPASGHLVTYLPDHGVLQELLTYFDKKHYQKGAVLIEQDGDDGEMLLVESGEVTVALRKEANSFLRLRTMGPGSIAGELALFGNQKRAASVIADSDVVAHSLDRDGLRRMEEEQPHLANRLHRAMSALLAERLLDTTSVVRALSR